jgi:hypothetical protein
MEERELVQLLQRAGEQVAPGPAPVRDILREGRAERRRRSGRVRVFALAAAAAAVIGGGSVAATVLDLPSLTGGADSAENAASGAGSTVDDGGAGGGAESAPTPLSGDTSTEGGAAAADAVDALVVTPGAVSPGDTVKIRTRMALSSFSDQSGFGIAWRLERLTDDRWSREYTLAWAGTGSDPTWWPAAEKRAVRDELVPYTAPFPLVIPQEATPGEYRICQTVGTEDLCGRLAVTG